MRSLTLPTLNLPRVLNWILPATVLGILFAFALQQPAMATAATDRQHDHVEQWLEEQGEGVVKGVLLTDPEWADELGLTHDAQVSFGSAHRFLVVGVADYDLRSKKIRGDLELEANIASSSDYCAVVVVEAQPSDTVICVVVTEGDVELTNLRQMGLLADISDIDASVDFIDDGPFGVYALRSGYVTPLNDTAEYNVPDRAQSKVFMEARSKRAAEHAAAARVDGLLLGGGPSLLAPDAEELEAWNDLVDAALEVNDSDASLAGEQTPKSERYKQPAWVVVIVVLALAGMFGIGIVRHRTTSRES